MFYIDDNYNIRRCYMRQKERILHVNLSSLNILLSLSNDCLLELLHVLLLVVVRQLMENLVSSLRLEISVIVEAFATDSTSEIQVLLHDSHS